MIGAAGRQRHDMRERIVRAVVLGSLAAALWFVFGDAERRTSLTSLGVGGSVALLALAAAGSIFVSLSWSAVAGVHTGVARTFLEYLVYQPAKYLPGGFAQGALQLSHIRSAVGSWKTSSGVFVAHVGVLIVGGLVVSIPEAVGRFGVWSVGLGVLLGSVVAVGAWRAGRRSALSVALPGVVPTSLGILSAAAGFALWGVAYGLAVATIGEHGMKVSSVSEFALGWVSGFVAFPIPAGIGVREAVLVAVSPNDPASVIAASIVVRIAVALAEVGLSGWALAMRRSE